MALMSEGDETYVTFTPQTPVPGEPFRVGERIGGCFQLRRLLGRGGMSCVYEADDTLLSRKVAVKVVEDPSLGATMLLHEAKALAAVRHHGLPQVHGLGVHRGWTYLVLERLFGITLEQHLETPRGARRLDLGEALPILAALGETLAAVHTAGMAHRDLKPGNIMLCGTNRTVLLDFGIVLPEVAAAEMPRSGTPRYLAPEVICGHITPGSAHLVDIYAFGTMAFEMFAGRPPFQAQTLVEMLEHHMQTPAPDLGDLRPDLPPRVPELIASCLAKDPAERPASMESVVWELRRLLRQRADASGPVRLATAAAQPTRETYRRSRELPAQEEQIPWEILIIEDDDDIRDGLATVLNARGCRAFAAKDGRDALDLIRRRGWRPALILLDLMMPVMDGQRFLEMQADDPCLDGIPVVLVTAQPSERARMFPAVRGVVPKPLELPALLDLIHEVCQSRRAQGG